MAQPVAEHLQNNFNNQLKQLQNAGALTRREQSKKLAGVIDALTADEDGIALVYDHIGEIIDAGFFKDTNWEDPAVLNFTLVGGTLKSGGMNTVYEIVSELRILAIAEGNLSSEQLSADGAEQFLEQLIVTNLGLLFPDASEEVRNVDQECRKRITILFDFLKSRFINWDRISECLAEELEMICDQRPIITDRTSFIIHTIKEQMRQHDGNIDSRLQRFIDAYYQPSAKSAKLSLEQYEAWLQNQKPGSEELRSECKAMAATLRETGLSSEYHALVLRHIHDQPGLIGELLGLNDHGKAELKNYHKEVSRIIEFACFPETRRVVYGLANLLERNLLSSQPVLNGLQKIMGNTVHPEVETIVKRALPATGISALHLIFADTLCLLGQPLGIGQGWNPTCQSARGMSIWSQHAPGKLLSLITTAITTNELEMRFECGLLKSSELPEGLTKEFDYNLDAVSMVLVPHLDRIYFEMMRRASGRGEDPHKWVNPAMYGQWIPTGFKTPYNYLTNTINDYEEFIRLFYATHHPEYNGGNNLSYPSPVGIFLTAANGKLLGFHAVSILRVARHKGNYRIYFLNPNNEGRQKWQSDIQPTVSGNGEIPGESSLPFYQFASRLYAFHYKPSESGGTERIPSDEIERIVEIARSSWGTSYIWSEDLQASPFTSLT